MLDWKTMESTWKMLPGEIRNRAIMDGLYNQEVPSQAMQSLGATNLSAPIQQMQELQTDQKW